MESVKALVIQADQLLQNVGILNDIEKRLDPLIKIPYIKVWVAGLVYLLLSISLFFHVSAPLVSNSIAFVYPCTTSLSLFIRDPGPELKHSALYYMCLSFWMILEMNIDWQEFIPLYYVIKVVLVVFLWNPDYKGIQLVLDFIVTHFGSLIKKLN